MRYFSLFWGINSTPTESKLRILLKKKPYIFNLFNPVLFYSTISHVDIYVWWAVYLKVFPITTTSRHYFKMPKKTRTWRQQTKQAVPLRRSRRAKQAPSASLSSHNNQHGRSEGKEKEGTTGTSPPPAKKRRTSPRRKHHQRKQEIQAQTMQYWDTSINLGSYGVTTKYYASLCIT